MTAQGTLPKTLTYPGHSGQTPLVDQLTPPVTTVDRTDPFVALTPNEVEVNREVAYLKNCPKVTN